MQIHFVGFVICHNKCLRHFVAFGGTHLSMHPPTHTHTCTYTPQRNKCIHSSADENNL